MAFLVKKQKNVGLGQYYACTSYTWKAEAGQLFVSSGPVCSPGQWGLQVRPYLKHNKQQQAYIGVWHDLHLAWGERLILETVQKITKIYSCPFS